MSNLFKNEYKVYLYKYNYSKLQQVVKDKFSENSGAYKYLFESFITDLYSIGVPSDEIKSKYNDYVNQYINDNKNKSSNLTTTQKSGKTKFTYAQVSSSLVDKDPNIFAYRSPKTIEENIVQEALAQNFALQKIQQDYEDIKMMGDDSKIHWLNTKTQKEAYESSIHNALEKSKELLDVLFNPIIDEITTMQNTGKLESEYVYCIDLTDLSKTQIIDNPTTDRTKNSCDNFLNPKIANRLISDDIETNALTSIGAIKTDISQLTNATSFVLRQDILLKYGIYLEPNDIIEITATNYNKTINKESEASNRDPLNRNTQFIGFITQLESSSKYGQVTDITVTCEGISKLLSLNPVVSDNAVMPQFNNLIDFIANKDDKTNPTANVNIYQTFYSGKTVYDLFTDIMSNVLASAPIKGDEKNYTIRYVSDNTKLKNLQYQFCKALIVLYHMAVTISTIRQCGPSAVIIAKVDCNILQTKLEAYLAQLRANFTNFWSTYSSPIQILNAIVESSFLEIYEDRCGILIMRTPRYNTWFGKDIIPMEDIISWTQTINDSILKSRSDYQWSIDYLGTMQNFPGNSYENIPALLKYGFRADSPKTSPNAKNERLCAVYAALDVTRENGKTRTLTVTVPMIKDYTLGKLYYIPIQDLYGTDGLKSSGCVGYLSSIASSISPGNVDEHRLEFKYVRSAELLEEDTSIKENYGRILNFNHLPDLEILMNLFTNKDFEQPASIDGDQGSGSGSSDSDSGLPAQYRYYWAAYEKVYKKIFDSYAAGTLNTTLSKKEKEYFDVTMAPTILTKGSFKSYKEKDKPTISNKSYIPTQQLINNIWYIDMCLRYNEDIVKDVTTDNSNKTAKTGLAGYRKYVGKLLRDVTFKNSNNQNADMSKILNYLGRDATFSSTKEAPMFITNDIFNPYARVDNFFINESLIPSMYQPINQDVMYSSLDKLNDFMNLFKNAYDYVTDSSFNRTKFIDVTSKSINYDVNDKNKKFNYICEDLQKVINEYNNCADNAYNFINLYNEIYTNLETKSENRVFISYMISLYISYISTKAISSYYETDKDTYIRLNMENSTLTFKSFYNYLNSNQKKGSRKSTAVVQLAPAVIMKPSVTVPPLLIFGDYSYGSFLAGISPVDYKPFFKNKISNLIKTEIPKVKGNIYLDDMTFKNALNETIGTITGFVYDEGLSQDNVNLYFYPIVKFNEGINIDGYINTKAELQQFANGSKVIKNDKEQKVLAVVCVSPVHIPESKIPTIQQMSRNGGLYVGKDSNNELNNKAAIFDTSVLFNWTKSELNATYSATIYNFLSSDISCVSKLNNKYLDIRQRDGITWGNKLRNKDDLRNTPCVFSSSVNFNKLKDKTFYDESVGINIKKLFDDLEKINNRNKFFTITKIEGTEKYQLEDTVTTVATEQVTDTIKLSYSYGEGDNSTVYKVSNDEALASVGGVYNDSSSDTFNAYTTSRENVQLGLYSHNERYSTIFYDDDKKYPTKVFRDTNSYAASSKVEANDINIQNIKAMQQKA